MRGLVASPDGRHLLATSADQTVCVWSLTDLGEVLAGHPEIANRFDARWKATVNEAVVQQHWPE